MNNEQVWYCRRDRITIVSDTPAVCPECQQMMMEVGWIARANNTDSDRDSSGRSTDALPTGPVAKQRRARETQDIPRGTT